MAVDVDDRKLRARPRMRRDDQRRAGLVFRDAGRRPFRLASFAGPNPLARTNLDGRPGRQLNRLRRLRGCGGGVCCCAQTAPIMATAVKGASTKTLKEPPNAIEKVPPQPAVSRILFPASARLRGLAAASAGFGEATIIPLAPSSLTGSSDLPGGFGRAVLVTPPYLALLRAGFCLPPVLPRARCALTAPFHPYPPSRLRRYGEQAQSIRHMCSATFEELAAPKRPKDAKAGGIFSVPLSFRSP